VRVTPQLVSTTDGTHVWAEVYDEPADEIFRVQSDIAQRVVQALDVGLREPERRMVQAAPTRSMEAYDYYLRGNDYVRRGFEEVTSRGPAAVRTGRGAGLLFAPAYALLSRMQSRMYWGLLGSLARPAGARSTSRR